MYFKHNHFIMYTLPTTRIFFDSKLNFLILQRCKKMWILGLDQPSWGESSFEMGTRAERKRLLNTN